MILEPFSSQLHGLFVHPFNQSFHHFCNLSEVAKLKNLEQISHLGPFSLDATSCAYGEMRPALQQRMENEILQSFGSRRTMPARCKGWQVVEGLRVESEGVKKKRGSLKGKVPACKNNNIMIIMQFVYIVIIPVVPGQAGGGSFQKEKNYSTERICL